VITDGRTVVPNLPLQNRFSEMKVLLIPLLISLSINALSQKKAFFEKTFVDVGWHGRITIFYLTGLRGQRSGKLINATAPYTYVSGVNGTGINISPGCIVSSQHNIAVQAPLNVRYDFYKSNNDGSYDNTIYVDQGFLITKMVKSRYYVGAGFTFFNIGKELHFKEGAYDKVLDLEFNSIDLSAGISLWKILIEPKVSIVQKKFPGTIKDNATLLGVRVFYRFNQ
jgi:hypothetical protein